jgi:hypothetical protein
MIYVLSTNFKIWNKGKNRYSFTEWDGEQSTTYEIKNHTFTSNEFYVWLAEEVTYFI